MFFHRKNQASEAPQPVVQLAPLPCPTHGATLITEPRGNGEWALYCPLCRLITQPVPAVQSRGATAPLRPGLVARAYTTALLRKPRLVAVDEHGRPQNTDALHFARGETVGEHPRVKQ
jgi:hypothetical protein